MTDKRILLARDIERLENTSLAAPFIGELDVPTIQGLLTQLDGLGTENSCEDCSCGCSDLPGICCPLNTVTCTVTHHTVTAPITAPITAPLDQAP